MAISKEFMNKLEEIFLSAIDDIRKSGVSFVVMFGVAAGCIWMLFEERVEHKAALERQKAEHSHDMDSVKKRLAALEVSLDSCHRKREEQAIRVAVLEAVHRKR